MASLTQTGPDLPHSECEFGSTLGCVNDKIRSEHIGPIDQTLHDLTGVKLCTFHSLCKSVAKWYEQNFTCQGEMVKAEVFSGRRIRNSRRWPNETSGSPVPVKSEGSARPCATGPPPTATPKPIAPSTAITQQRLEYPYPTYSLAPSWQVPWSALGASLPSNAPVASAPGMQQGPATEVALGTEAPLYSVFRFRETQESLAPRQTLSGPHHSALSKQEPLVTPQLQLPQVDSSAGPRDYVPITDQAGAFTNHIDYLAEAFASDKAT